MGFIEDREVHDTYVGSLSGLTFENRDLFFDNGHYAEVTRITSPSGLVMVTGATYHSRHDVQPVADHHWGATLDALIQDVKTSKLAAIDNSLLSEQH